MTQPVLSIVMAVYNSAATLQRCLDSFALQDYPHRELIIMDGGSSDGSTEILHENKHLISHWESEPDTGVYNAWNKALTHVTGDWVYFLGSDDRFYTTDVLSRVAGWLKSCPPSTRIAYGRVALFSAAGEALETRGEPWPVTRQRLNEEMCMHHAGVFHHRTLFDIHGRFNETFRIAGDYEFVLRELKEQSGLFMDDVIVTATTLGGLSSLPGNTLITRMEEAKARKLNGMAPYPFRWWLGICRALVYQSIGLVAGKRAAMSARDRYRKIVGR